MIRTIIIDDEAHNRDTLRKLLSRHCPQVSVIGEATGVADGITAIKKFHPDLVILDIHMNDGSGFDLLNAFATIDFKVIFISAFDRDTIRAFRLSDVRYLLKPVNPAELKSTVDQTVQNDQEYFRLRMLALDANVKK
jgi:two-component system LytT family response regulator